jgi:hypothetical protein
MLVTPIIAGYCIFFATQWSSGLRFGFFGIAPVAGFPRFGANDFAFGLAVVFPKAFVRTSFLHGQTSNPKRPASWARRFRL